MHNSESLKKDEWKKKKKVKDFIFFLNSIARDWGIWKININHIKQFNWKQWYFEKREIEYFKLKNVTKKCYIQLGTKIVVKLNFACDDGW